MDSDFVHFGDSVQFFLFDQPLYIDQADGHIKVSKDAQPTTFTLLHPANSQNKAVILGGAGVLMMGGGKPCMIQDDGFVICGSESTGTKIIRILDKHGQDKVKLQNGHYVKLRQPKNGIDCSIVPGQQSLNCKIKRSWQYYGLVMQKV